jgi:cytosine/adenosine deaminase-related metal-dependent hydrolase
VGETLTLYARHVVPVTSPPIDDGAVLIENGRVRAVGRRKEFDASGRIEDLGDVWLLPGFVNAHTHLELGCYAGQLGPGGFWTWIEGLIELRRHPGAVSRERAAVTDGARQSLEAGVTCVGDISRSGLNVAALADFPIRKVCFIELISGASPPGDPDQLIEALDEAAEAADDLTTIGVSPHALYSVTWNDLRRTAAIAAQRDLPITLHAAETADEIEWLRDGSGAVAEFLSRHGLPSATAAVRGRVIELLHRLLMTRLRPLLAHMNFADAAELSMLADTRCSVAYCPRTHAFFGHPPHGWREMLARGINVAIGTDSLASNDSLSIWDELRFLRRLAPDASPARLVEMGTRRAAAALGLEADCGAIRPGLWADLVALRPCENRQSGDLSALMEQAIGIDRVWVAGRSVVRNGTYDAALPVHRDI